MFTEKQIEKLMKRVEKSETCWNWTGPNRRVCINGKKWKVARVMWTIYNGQIEDGMDIRRTCKNKYCVNPGHLKLFPGRNYFKCLEDKFEYFIDKSGDCWNWTGGIGHEGYGDLNFNHKKYLTHRFSYELHNGKIPEGKLVCHKCNNRKCVNPDHLYAGTQKQNSNDMILAGTLIHGKDHCHAKITEKDAVEIQRLYAQGGWTHRTLAEKFRINHSNIGNILRGTRWKHTNLGLEFTPDTLNKGETHNASKLTEKQVIEIRDKYANGECTYKQLGGEYGVVLSAIQKIIKRDSWKHVL